MMSHKKIFIFIFCFLAVFLIADSVFSAEEIEINFFYSRSCPHCAEENSFLSKLENNYCNLHVNRFIVSEGDNWQKLKQLYAEYNVPEEYKGAVPITFIKDKYFLGYRDDETTGREIENFIKALIEPCPTSTNGSTTEPIGTSTMQGDSVTFFGRTIDFEKASPLVLAIVLGLLDGFNACAMVALAFLLTMLIATGIRKRIILIGGTFILVSGIIYYFFTAAWLNLFLISKSLDIITTIVGVIVIIFSVFLLRDYFLGIVCRICRIERGKENVLIKTQRGFFDKLKKLTKSKASLPILLLGVAVIAAGVNMIELVCSFGFPLAFAKVLSASNLSSFSHYFYIFIYIFFYMLDDFVIFLLAVFTLKITGISEKYLRIVKLISAIVLLILGFIMLFRPELLSFV